MKKKEKVAQEVGNFMAERDFFARSLGIEILEIRPGYSRVGMPIAPYMVNGLKIAHGGAIFSLGDFAFAAASNSYGQVAVALSMDIHFLRAPETGAYLTAEALEVRRGRRTGLYRISVIESSGRQIAEMHGMAFIKDEEFIS